MRVYLVYWCNNEPYEDYHELVDSVFSTRDGAVGYIAAQGYRPHVCKGEWEKRNMAHYFDSEHDEYGEHNSMWVREMDVFE